MRWGRSSVPRLTVPDVRTERTRTHIRVEHADSAAWRFKPPSRPRHAQSTWSCVDRGRNAVMEAADDMQGQTSNSSQQNQSEWEQWSSQAKLMRLASMSRSHVLKKRSSRTPRKGILEVGQVTGRLQRRLDWFFDESPADPFGCHWNFFFFFEILKMSKKRFQNQDVRPTLAWRIETHWIVFFLLL